MTLDERRRHLYLIRIPPCRKYDSGSSGECGSYGTYDDELNFNEWARRRKNGPTDDDFVGNDYEPPSPRVELNERVKVDSKHLKYFYSVCDVDGVTHSVLMTKTVMCHGQLEQNNYFFLQLLAKKLKIQQGNRGSPTKAPYMVCYRMGDVGSESSITKQKYFDDVASALREFVTIFESFTNRPWSPLRNFGDDDRSGKYYFVKLAPTSNLDNHSSKGQVDLALMFNSLRVSDSKISEFLNFIRMGEDDDDVNKVWMREELDVSQIAEARAVLQKIQKGILKKVSVSEQQLHRDTAKFYAKIPHFHAKVRNMPVLIAGECALYQKLKLLDDLEGYHPSKFHSRLRHVAECESDYKIITRAVRESHGVTHKGFRLKVDSVLAFNESDVTSPEKRPGELLWHGSHVTNTACILKRGFQLPLWGEQMFGPAVYFSSCVSKAAKYCCVPTSQYPPRRGVLFLCELDLGKKWKMTASHNFKGQIPAGYDSIMGVGQYGITNPTEMCSGAWINVGPPCDNGPQWINYDEFAVCDVSRIKIRFVVTVEFH